MCAHWELRCARCLSASGEFLLCGDVDGNVTVRTLGDLAVVHTLRPGGPSGGAGSGARGSAVHSVAVSDNDRFVLLGVDGSPLLVATDPVSVANSMQSRLKEGMFGLG